ncbi:MAG: hypothetical protein E7664_04600 [Ruminococcaceae bacterium]|nr:hypothetical protein [Oscillospiraceae bacterium]
MGILLRRSLFLCLSLLLLGGCAKQGPREFLMFEEAYTCVLSWERQGVGYRARLCVGEPAEERTLSLAYEEPSSMAGITVVRESGCVRATVGGRAFEAPEAAAWLSVGLLFDLGEDVGAYRTETHEGKTVYFADAVTVTGEAVSLEVGQGVPTRLLAKDTVVYITDWETK